MENVHGVDGEGHSIPPSTLAAQLAESHAHPGRPQQPGDDEALKQLLNEICTSPESLDTDIESNHVLISVISNAALRTTSASGLASNIDRRLAGIQAIKIAFRRNPSVLFHAKQKSDGLEDQLCLQLLPNIFAVATSAEDLAIVDSVESLLVVLLSAFRGKLQHAGQFEALQELMLGSAEDLLLSLQARSQPSDLATNDLVLPSNDTRCRAFGEMQASLALSSGPRVNISNVLNALLLSTALARAGASYDGRMDGFVEESQISVLVASRVLAIAEQAYQIAMTVSVHSDGSSSTSLQASALRIICPLVQSSIRSDCDRAVRKRIEKLALKAISAALFQETLPPAEQLQEIVQHFFSCCRMLAASSLRFSHGLYTVLGLDTESSPTSAAQRLLPDLENTHLELISTVRNKIHGHVDICTASNSSQERPAKRRKNYTGDAEPHRPDRSARDNLAELCLILGDWNVNDMKRLAADVESLFSDVDEAQQIRVLHLMSLMFCGIAQAKPLLHGSTADVLICLQCGSPSTGTDETTDQQWNDEQWTIFHDMLCNLARSSSVQSSKGLRVCFSSTVRCFAWHTPIRQHLVIDSSKTSLGSWCLQSLCSSYRELRQAAAHLLPALCHDSSRHPDDVCLNNRRLAMQYLRDVADNKEPRLAETVITALVELSRSGGDEELNLILLQLVDFLGHKNPLICSLSHVGLREVANSKRTDLNQLFSPFWGSVAIQAVKDLPAKPQKLQQLSDLLGWSANLFLMNTQYHTVPYLVLWKQREVLRRVAQARSEDANIWSLCMTKRNMTSILALIFAEQPLNPEMAIVDCLGQAHPDFAKQDPVDLVKSDIITLACEVLKIAADRHDDARDKALQGFKELTSLIERRAHSTRTSTMQARMITLFLENHALGIMQAFSDTIDSPSETLLMKRRCLRAVEQMILVGGAEVAVALPQIRSCLHSALEVLGLVEQAFATWLTLVCALDNDDDLGAILESTFVIVAQHWNDVSTSNQIKAHDTIGWLIKDHQALVQEYLRQLPSFGSIPMMSKYENEIKRLRDKEPPSTMLTAFIGRLKNENSGVVRQALIELVKYLRDQQSWIIESCALDQPDPVISSLLRCLLDVAAEYGPMHEDIASLVVQCLGLIGAVDPSRVEAAREKHELVILSNFEQAEDALAFVAHVLEHVLVKAFNSVSNPRAQGFLAYAMQELLKFCGFDKQNLLAYRPHGSQGDDLSQRWLAFSEPTRNTLTPFLSSRYVLTARQNTDPNATDYPIFSIDKTYGSWIKEFAFNLMLRAEGTNAVKIFSVLARIVKSYDTSIAAFLIPFIAANVITSGPPSGSADVVKEMRGILETEPSDPPNASEANLIRQASDTVFQIYDYLSRWLHDKRKQVSADKTLAARTGKPLPEGQLAADELKIRNVENVLSSISAKSISKRATAVGSSTRALLHWEVHIRQQKGQVAPVTSLGEPDQDMFKHLHRIYAFLDEPDGLEGISAHIKFLSPEEKVLDYQRAGNWTAAESWFESFMRNNHGDGNELDIRQQEDLVYCLAQAGKDYAVIDHIASLPNQSWASNRIKDAVTEASWRTENWHFLDRCLRDKISEPLASFNSGVGYILNSIRKADLNATTSGVSSLRARCAAALNPATTTSIKAVHTSLLQLQVLDELEMIANLHQPPQKEPAAIYGLLQKRLDLLGSYANDKQYLLGIRRAAMSLCKPRFSNRDIGNLWMTSARLSRKGGAADIAHKSAVNASECGDATAAVEQARYIWRLGEHRKAIQSLESIISNGSLRDEPGDGPTTNAPSINMSISTTAGESANKPSLAEAKAHLLLAKWLDKSGQTSSADLNAHYRNAANSFHKWEKGYYYLGRFYNKLLEAEQKQPLSKQDGRMLSCETTKLVVENYLRSLIFGCKYLSETMPKLLTLWLDTGAEATRNTQLSKEIPEDVRAYVTAQKPKNLDLINKQMRKYGEKISSWLFYTALNQMLTRIGHSNPKVYEVLAGIITRVVSSHPQQGLWALLAVVKSSKPDRANRGISILGELKKRSKNIRHQSSDLELRNLISQGQKLADALLDCCNRAVDGRVSIISLKKDLKFNSNVTPCALVVPWETTLLPKLPSISGGAALLRHKAFPMSRDAVTIQEFMDDVLVLSSLQRPRKLVVRGSDGKTYGLLCKPKDDLRKDQRLMEFNTMINRSLMKDNESMKRRLYIKTYAVTPLNEECGAIEWVEGLKPLRDILLSLYRQKGIKVDYASLKELLNTACDPRTIDGHLVFTNQILGQYAPALHEWFTEKFPSPDAWFAARTRYTRSCAVMSMSGHVLGLGDRHGENVLLEEGSGGVFHVDFNCLFDKGLTFEKPELVPFRLTHNMVDAFGAHGVEGPFRRSAECTMNVMRAVEGALLTIMETFVYDPTADFVGSRRRHIKGVPETPREVLDSVSGKVRGLMKGDSVPLSVEGHVDRLIQEARDPKKLCAMYIGWCAFL